MRAFSMMVAVSLLAISSFAAEADEGFRYLGNKESFSHIKELKLVPVFELMNRWGAEVCLGGDVHSVPSKLPRSQAFVVGFPQKEGGEQLVHMWNNEGAGKILHCIMDPELKARHYFIDKQYLSRRQN